VIRRVWISTSPGTATYVPIKTTFGTDVRHLASEADLERVREFVKMARGLEKKREGQCRLQVGLKNEVVHAVAWSRVLHESHNDIIMRTGHQVMDDPHTQPRHGEVVRSLIDGEINLCRQSGEPVREMKRNPHTPSYTSQ